MLGRMIVRGIEYHPAPKPSPEAMAKRGQISSVVIIVIVALWIAYACCH
jgi:hypothetical protein